MIGDWYVRFFHDIKDERKMQFRGFSFVIGSLTFSPIVYIIKEFEYFF